MHLESVERSVLVWVWPTSAGLIADTEIDREWEPGMGAVGESEETVSVGMRGCRCQ